jgi:hypothetical protein
LRKVAAGRPVGEQAGLQQSKKNFQQESLQGLQLQQI